jgi:sugar lactone lactonase YvrE
VKKSRVLTEVAFAPGTQSRLRSVVVVVLAFVALAVLAFVALAVFAERSEAAVSAPTWFPLSPSLTRPAAEDGAGAFDPATNQFVTFGGFNNSGLFLNDTWVWSGSGWLQQHPASSPAARFGVRMAYDTTAVQLLLFGGANGTPFNDTWNWNGTNWVQLHPAASPPLTAGEGMAYDPATNQLLIFGGSQLVGNVVLTQPNTWSWDGSNWHQLSPATLPPGRVDPAMAWDPATKQLIMFGGGIAGGQFLNDTWLWNGTSWVQQAPASKPTPRSGARLVYDPATAQMLLMGGVSAAGALGDVWTWSGSTWTKQTPARALTPPRFNSVTDYDPATRQLLLFGGFDNTTYYADTWLWTPFAVGEPTLPAATVGLRYTTQLDAIAGTAPYTWSVSSGTLPTGLTLSPAGSLSGTPQTAGAFTFTVSVTDSAAHTATRSYTLTVNAAPTAGVWVSNGANSLVHAFALNANGQASPTVTLGAGSTQLNGPAGLALDSAGELYVANSDTPSVTVFASGANGTVAPLRTLAGTNTQLVDPSGIALDSGGRLYVANGPAGAVTVYAAGASGNQAPVQRIAGANTLLRQPLGVVIDAQGHIWVADFATSALLEFASTANGNVAPIGKIAGVLTGLNGPDSIAVSPMGRLLVSNLFGGSVTEYAIAPPMGDVPADFTISGTQAQIHIPEGLDADAANDVYLANELGGLNQYPPSSTSPAAVVSGSATGILAPQAVAVAPPMMIANHSLPAAGIGRRYAAGLFAVLGSPPLRWRITHGRLPAGLRLSRSGHISGVARRLGTFTFSVEVTGSSKRVPSDTRRLAISVRRAPTMIALRPTRGASVGGTKVTVTGSGFATAAGSTAIDFGRLRALKVRCRSHTVCTARTPAHARGRITVTATVAGLGSVPAPGAHFTYRR